MNAFTFVSRTVALLLPVLLLLLVWLVLIQPLVEFSAVLQQSHAALENQLAAAQREATAEPNLATAVTNLRAQNMAANGMRTEAIEAQAIAGLQNDVQQIIAQNNGQIMSIQPLQLTKNTGYTALSMQVSLSLATASLPALLEQIESHQPYMFIETCAIANQGVVTTESDNNPTLNVQLTIAADWRTP
jgi:hypothetical protein